MDKLAESQIKKFYVRVEILREFYKREAYSDVIREAQEALELGLKALLRTMGVEPSFTHDPGKELIPYQDRIPLQIVPLFGEIVKKSKMLRRERELAFYGAVDFIPTEEYTAEDALLVIEFLEKLTLAFRSTFDIV